MLVNVDNAIIDLAIRAIDNEIGRMLVAKEELLRAKEKPVDPTAIGVGTAKGLENLRKGPLNLRKRDSRPKAIPKRPEDVRRFVTQADIVTVLEHADEPLTEFKIREQLDELLNVNVSEAILKKVLGVKLWKKGAKRYRKNEGGAWELYDPDDEE